MSPSYSPEQGDFSAGAAMSEQIVWELLTNTIEASTALGLDATLRTQWQGTLSQLDPGLRTGSWGQLQEWKTDWDSQTNDHRHVSQLYALYPGRQISPLTTPAFAQAAKVSLTARGDAGTGWSKAWKINFWARLDYLPRQDGGTNGTIADYQIQVSTDGTAWTQVAAGTFTAGNTLKSVTFAPTTARHVRLRTTRAANGAAYSSAAEISLYGRAA